MPTSMLRPEENITTHFEKREEREGGEGEGREGEGEGRERGGRGEGEGRERGGRGEGRVPRQQDLWEGTPYHLWGTQLDYRTECILFFIKRSARQKKKKEKEKQI